MPRPFYPETPFRSFCISTPTTVPRIRVVTLFFSILLRIHWFVAWCCCCCELVELNCREDSSYDTTHTQNLHKDRKFILLHWISFSWTVTAFWNRRVFPIIKRCKNNYLLEILSSYLYKVIGSLKEIEFSFARRNKILEK